MRALSLSVAVAMILAAPQHALAQQTELSKWDSGVSFGLLFGNGWHPDSDSYGEPHAAYQLESYFNERTYIKSELSFAFNGSGVSHSILRIGFGFDF